MLDVLLLVWGADVGTTPDEGFAGLLLPRLVDVAIVIALVVYAYVTGTLIIVVWGIKTSPMHNRPNSNPHFVDVDTKVSREIEVE